MGTSGSAHNVVDKTRRGIMRVLLVAVGALAAAFALLNGDRVEVQWIFGSPIDTPLILVIFVSLLLGVVIGFLVAKLTGRSSS